MSYIPQLTSDQIANIPSAAEQKVYKVLQEQLPKDWLVVHSLEFVMKTSKYNSHGDREADFVIFAPEYGVLVVEVKGGGIRYDKHLNQWYSINNSGEYKIKNPLRQAKDAKYEIRGHLKHRMSNKNLLLAHGVLFPDIDTVHPLVSPDIPTDILGGYDSLLDLKSWIEDVFKYWAGESPIYDPLEKRGVDIAEEIYGKHVSIEPSLRVAIEDEIQKQILLTNQQKNILRQLKRRKEAIIEGGAGTGKTVLALDHARNLASQGLRVLLLCYNEGLGYLLKQKTQDLETLDAMYFHLFCENRIKDVKEMTGRDLFEESKITYPDKNIYYDIVMPDALSNSYEVSPIIYDAIIIDEGQDFKAEYWLAIEMLKEQQEDTRLYIFQDTNQAIYGEPSDLPIDDIPLTLIDNCRNTKYIHDLAYHYYKGEVVEAPAVDGSPIEYIIEQSVEKQATAIDKKVYNLIHNEGIAPKDIAVIVMGKYDKVYPLLKSSKHREQWSFKTFSPHDKVLVETARRFKGLESKIILLWVPYEETLDDTLLYISISRARFRLWIVGDKKLVHHQ